MRETLLNCIAEDVSLLNGFKWSLCNFTDCYILIGSHSTCGGWPNNCVYSSYWVFVQEIEYLNIDKYSVWLVAITWQHSCLAWCFKSVEPGSDTHVEGGCFFSSPISAITIASPLQSFVSLWRGYRKTSPCWLHPLCLYSPVCPPPHFWEPSFLHAYFWDTASLTDMFFSYFLS